MITPARLEWRGPQPFATEFDDIYYSRDGVDEVRRVFLQPAEILSKAQDQPVVSIGELGFGSGLNFAVTAQQILQNTRARLHFISFEAHPLSANDWRTVARHYRTSLPLYDALTQPPPALTPGWQQRRLGDGRVVLWLYHGDVSDGLSDLQRRRPTPLDAWYLDGFAPDKNPQMWDPALFDQIASLSHPGTTVATFTAAGRVKRALQGRGFRVEKVDQQPFKRESIRATLAAQDGRPSPPANTAAALEVPEHSNVFGAGIAGACVARQLAEQGVKVTVWDPNGIAGGASKMQRVVMHARLLGDGSDAADWRAAAFFYAMHYNRQFDGVETQGVLQIQGPNLNEAKLERICRRFAEPLEYQGHWIERLSPEQAAQRCGFQPAGDGLWFAQAAVMNLPKFCQDLLDHPNIQFHARQAEDTHGINVLAAGTASRELGAYEWLEIADVYGQLDRVRAQPNQPSAPVVGHGYIVPGPEETVLGATYEYRPWPEQQASEHNRDGNTHFINGSVEVLGSQRGARTVSSDRSPVVGQLDDTCWISSGYGSMGAVGAPLGAAVLCSQLLGTAPAVSSNIEKLLEPQRFLRRQAKRGIRHQSRER